MKVIKEKVNLTESSLSRLRDYMKQYDIICISADKYLPNRADYATQAEFETKFADRLGKHKKLDRKALLIELKAAGYVVIRVKGFYQYQAIDAPSKEFSYCVVNINNRKDFVTDLLKKAVDCKQNSIYFVPRNLFEGFWIYTGIDLSYPDEKDPYHSYGDMENRGPVHFGKFATTDDGTGYSLVNGRPFASYTSGEVQTDVKIPKVRNTSKNITVIEEAFVHDDVTVGNTITAQEGAYATKVRKACK